jgi:hypothetical protein
VNKSVKRPKDKKDGKSAAQDAQARKKSDQPAQEIANDEIEIAETGGKPGAGSKPITNR